MLTPYTLIRTNRKSLALQINNQGNLIARSPLKMSITQVEQFIDKKIAWIQKHKLQIQNRIPRKIPDTSQISVHKKNLKEYIIPRVHTLWQGKNLPQISSIKITQSEKSWGSCSSKNGLCFSYRLAEYLEQTPTDTQTQWNENIDPKNNKDTPVSVSSVCICSSFIDAVIIHELAHLIEKNHQKPFWNLVYSWMPEYETIMKNRCYIKTSQ